MFIRSPQTEAVKLVFFCNGCDHLLCQNLDQRSSAADAENDRAAGGTAGAKNRPDQKKLGFGCCFGRAVCVVCELNSGPG
jgi:hypothetical protein